MIPRTPVAPQTLSGPAGAAGAAHADAPALSDAHFRFSYRETREQVSALARQ
ncbi:Uncharacterised protein [Serratia rubidaea]|uniref:Uncharacterized protein n=1 Tax=Serratia rubidaea TaxID=61652 RepID=A0A4U9HSI4_SERRU|nr:Uncharacterised protein [Serratia rubidaea]